MASSRASTVERILPACEETLAASPDCPVLLDDAAITSLAGSLDAAAAKAAWLAAPGVRWPLAFSSLDEELSFIGLLSLLRFGSAWNDELKSTTDGAVRGEGALERTQRGLLSLLISGTKLDADGLQNTSEFGLAQAWGLHLQKDVPHPSVAALKVQQDVSTRPYSRLVARTLEETGRKLWERQAPSLGAFILSSSPSAAALVDSLVAALPGFGCDPPFCCKALRLAGELHRRMAGEPGFDHLADVDSLPAPAEPALVLALVSLGMIQLKMGPGAEAALRAAAVLAAQRVAAAAGTSPMVAAHWLQKRAKAATGNEEARAAALQALTARKDHVAF